MKKSVLTIISLLCLSSICFGQLESELNFQCQKSFFLYQVGNSSRLLENWKVEKGQSVNISELLKIQSDVYGELSNPKEFSFRHSYGHRDKHIELNAQYDSVFIEDLDASLEIFLYKGKKKKDDYQFQNVRIKSRNNSPNKFIDSLCAPYLTMIQNNQADSISELLFSEEKWNQLQNEVSEIKSKKKRKNAMMSLGFMKMGIEMIKKQILLVDPDTDYDYESSVLTLQDLIPTLTAGYIFKDESGNDIHFELSFQIQNNGYIFTNVSFKTKMNAPNIN